MPILMLNLLETNRYFENRVSILSLFIFFLHMHRVSLNSSMAVSSMLDSRLWRKENGQLIKTILDCLDLPA